MLADMNARQIADKNKLILEHTDNFSINDVKDAMEGMSPDFKEEITGSKVRETLKFQKIILLIQQKKLLEIQKLD